MKIIILGGNQVGSTLAETLVRENHDVTVVDQDPDKLHELNQRLDIQTVTGSACHPNVLKAAAAAEADLLIAVTSNDEVNLVACQVAYSLFKVPKKIARIRSPQYLNYPELFNNVDLPVDVFISPEQLVTEQITQLIQHPGALQVLNFAEGKLKLVAIRPLQGGPLINKTISEIHNLIKADIRVVAIYQGDQPIIPEGSTLIKQGDEVFFLAENEDIIKGLNALGRLDKTYQRIMIAGGNTIGAGLARALEKDYQVKIIESDKKRAEELAGDLNEATVLHGDASSRELLLSENIENTDIYCAVTDDDENNIMSCLLAKRLGARRVISLIKHGAYVDLIEGGKIDIAISPQQATTNSILRFVRQGDIVNAYSLRRDAAEAIEIIAHGDHKSSKIVGRKIDEIKLPPGSSIGAVVRGEKVLMAKHDLVIESDDHVVLFVVNKKNISEVEKLFQVNLGFFKKA